MEFQLLNMDTKRHIQKILTLLLLAGGTLSCLPENLLIQVEPAPSQLVISSINVDTLGLAVLVTRSFSALEGNEDSLSQDFINQIVVSDAEVRLTTNAEEILLEGLEDIDGVYFTQQLSIEDNETLRLDVFDPQTGMRVSAETAAVPAVSLDTVGFFEEIVDEDTIHMLFYSFTDPMSDNWYSLNVFDPLQFANEVGENIFSLNGGNSGLFYERLLSDQELTERVYSVTVELFDPIASDTIAFFFTNITEGYFRFLDVRQRFGGILSDSEPVNFPTNVVGGLGYFTFNRPQIRIVTKERVE